MIGRDQVILMLGVTIADLQLAISRLEQENDTLKVLLAELQGGNDEKQKKTKRHEHEHTH